MKNCKIFLPIQNPTYPKWMHLCGEKEVYLEDIHAGNYSSRKHTVLGPSSIPPDVLKYGFKVKKLVVEFSPNPSNPLATAIHPTRYQRCEYPCFI